MPEIEFDTIEIGSVLDFATGKRLAVCSYVKRVLFSRESSPSVHHFCYVCLLERGVSGTCGDCGSHGRVLKFKPCFAGVRVVWVCPKTVGLPDPES